MANITVGDKRLEVKDKATALVALTALALSKDKAKMLETMLLSVDAGAMSYDAWTTVAQSFSIMPKRSSVEGGWKSVLIDRHPEVKDRIAESERLADALDEVAGKCTVEGEKDGKKVSGKLTYRIVVNFVADSAKKDATATAAPVKAPAPVTTAKGKK